MQNRHYRLNEPSQDMKDIAHPHYLYRLPDWVQIRDCYKGSRAIKEAGQCYLPKLGGQSDPDYANYLMRALFFPITGKTATTLVGYATFKKPKVEYPETMKSYFDDTEMKNQFSELYIALLTENLLQGRIGVLIDAPLTGAPLPKLATYHAENIINWWTDDSGKLVALLLREYVDAKDPDKPFKTVCQERFRYCHLDGGVYKVRVYVDEKLKDHSGDQVPTFAGKALDYIPFTCIGATGVHMDVDVPPMLDISSINISHYMSSADLEWGRHFVGLPTPVVKGVDASTKLSIGGTSAWILPDKDADAKYLEFVGQGLKSLENALQEKIGLMATMSARLVDSSSKGSEASETVRLRYMSETATLSQIITATEAGLNIIYNTVAKMLNDSPVKIALSRDFLNSMITAPVLKALFEAYFQGGLSKQSLIYNLRKSEYLDPNISDEEEAAAIQDFESLQAARVAQQRQRQSNNPSTQP